MGGIGEIVGGVVGAASLFGGGGNDEPQATQVQTMTPEQEALLKRMSELALLEIEKRPVPYTGERVAGPSPLQAGVFEKVLGSLGTGLPSPIQQELFGRVQEQLPTFVQSPQQAAAQASGVFQQTIGDPSRRRFLQETAPALQEQFIGANALRSSGFQRQLAKQARELEQGLSAQEAAMVDAAQQRRLQDILGISQIAQQEGQIPSQQLSQLIQAGLLGAEQRSIEQQRLNAELQEFLRVNQVPTPALAGVLGLPLSASAFQSVVQQPSASPFSSLAGGFGTSLGNMLFNL